MELGADDLDTDEEVTMTSVPMARIAQLPVERWQEQQYYEYENIYGAGKWREFKKWLFKNALNFERTGSTVAYEHWRKVHGLKFSDWPKERKFYPKDYDFLVPFKEIPDEIAPTDLCDLWDNEGGYEGSEDPDELESYFASLKFEQKVRWKNNTGQKIKKLPGDSPGLLKHNPLLKDETIQPNKLVTQFRVNFLVCDEGALQAYRLGTAMLNRIIEQSKGRPEFVQALGDRLKFRTYRVGFYEGIRVYLYTAIRDL